MSNVSASSFSFSVCIGRYIPTRKIPGEPKDAIDAMAHGEPLLFGFDVQVAGAGGDGLREQLVDEAHHRLWILRDGRLRVLLLLAQDLDVEKPFRLPANVVAAIQILDSQQDRVAVGEVKDDVATRREGEGVLALDVERVGGRYHELAIPHRERQDAVLPGPALGNETGCLFGCGLEVRQRDLEPGR